MVGILQQVVIFVPLKIDHGLYVLRVSTHLNQTLCHMRSLKGKSMLIVFAARFRLDKDRIRKSYKFPLNVSSAGLAWYNLAVSHIWRIP